MGFLAIQLWLWYLPKRLKLDDNQISNKITNNKEMSKWNVRNDTHEGFRSESGTGSNIAAEVPDPQHRRSRWDLPLRGLMAFAITGPTIHCWTRNELGFPAGEPSDRTGLYCSVIKIEALLETWVPVCDPTPGKWRKRERLFDCSK